MPAAPTGAGEARRCMELSLPPGHEALLPTVTPPMLPRPHGVASISRWTLFAILALWAGVVLHEAGHFIVGPALHAGLAAWGAGSVSLRRVLGTGGGPAVTLALVFAAWAYGRQRASRSANAAAHCAVAFIVACTAAVRLLLLAPAVVFGRTGFDESRLARLTGMPVILVWGVPTLGAALAALTLARNIPPAARRPVYLGLLTGLVVGLPMVLLLGPRLGLPI